MTWREGYLRQAKSDFAVYLDLHRKKEAICHRLHYLQMASEKLTKSYLCYGSHRPYKKTHYALVRLLEISKGRAEMRRMLGYGRNPLAYSSFIDSILGTARALEDLSPVGGDYDKVNPEYPGRIPLA